MSGFQAIVALYDSSLQAKAALSVAFALAQRLGARLHLIHVIRPLYLAGGIGGETPITDLTGVRQAAMNSLCNVTDRFQHGPKGFELHVVEGTSVAGTIRRSAAILGADLIVMGTHQRRRLPCALFGGVTGRILRRPPCPVLGVPVPERESGK
jgi:nucleotide-binding universal stress UspA family protein